MTVYSTLMRRHVTRGKLQLTILNAFLHSKYIMCAIDHDTHNSMCVMNVCVCYKCFITAAAGLKRVFTLQSTLCVLYTRYCMCAINIYVCHTYLITAAAGFKRVATLP